MTSVNETIIPKSKKDKQPLTRDEILLKYYHSQKLREKFENSLLKCGIAKKSRLLEDCIQETFMELARKEPREFEEKYMETGKGDFEGYIYMTFKNACIRRSYENPNGCLLAKMRHASSIACNGSISPTDSFIDDDSDYYNLIIADKLEGDYNHNKMFKFILLHLNEEEATTLNLMIDKKATKGRYKKEVKLQVEAMKVKFKELVIKYDEGYAYEPRERQFKTDAEIEEILNPKPININKRNQHDDSVGEIEES